MFEIRKNKALTFLILGAVSIGFSSIFVKAVGKAGVGLTAIAFWRMALGGIVLFAVALLRRKSPFLPVKTILWASLAGLFFSLDLIVWHRSIMYAGAGMATILGNTQVFHTAILGYLFFNDRPGTKFYALAVSAMLGVTLLAGVGSNLAFTDQYLLGITLGLATGVCYASYLMVLRKVGHGESKPSTMIFIAWVCFFSSIFLALGSTVEEGDFVPKNMASWSNLLGLALLVQVFGWWAIFYSISKIETSRVGLVLLLQPAVATLLGFLIFRENLSFLQTVGGAVTLTSIYYGVKLKKRV